MQPALSLSALPKISMLCYAILCNAVFINMYFFRNSNLFIAKFIKNW